MTRIVAGRAGGRRLVVPPGQATRPTAERAREALFSSLESLGGVTGRRVLDLYAGSGALGLEALSRGAAEALLVENDAAALQALRANVRSLALPGARVAGMPVERLLAEPPEAAFDIVLADPPYALRPERVAAVLRALAEGGWLAADAVVVVERASRAGSPDWPAGIEPLRARRYGEATLWYGRASRRVGSERRARPSSGREVDQVRRAVCPGSFDPVTNGHLDIIGRAAAAFDEVVVAVLINKSKAGLFTVEERMDLLAGATAEYGNVTVESFHGLLVDFCRERHIPVIVKGLRAVSDFDYELQMAQMNHSLAGVETLFMTTNPLYSFLSSSLVKEVATWGGDVAGLVPSTVLERMTERLEERRR